MKRLLTAAAALCCVFGFTLAHAQLTTPTASSISMGGVPIAAGTVTFTPVNTSGIPIAFATGGGGLNSPTAFSCSITNGAITGSCQIPDAALTTPANILYSVTITNTATQKSFTLQQVANVTGTTWALDHYGPPAQTTNVQATQTAYGTAAAPGSCVTPSFYVRNAGGGQLYACVAGTFVLVTGSVGSVTYGTTAGTAAEGNDSRIVGAEQSANKGAASGYAGLDSSSHLLAANQPARTGDVTNTAGSLANTLATVNSNVGACGDATHVGQVTLDAKGRATSCAAVAITSAGTVNAGAMQSALSGQTGCTTAGYFWSPQSNTCLAASGGTTPGATAALYAWNGSAWVAATAAQVQAALSSDTVNNSQLIFSTESGGDSTCPTPTSGKDMLCMKNGAINYSHNGGGYAPLSAPAAYATLTDGATVAWATGGAASANAVLTLVHTTSTRTLNVSGLASGAGGTLILKEDATGGSSTFNLGTGCTWFVGGSTGFTAASTLTLTSTASAINILAFTYDGTNCYGNLR